MFAPHHVLLLNLVLLAAGAQELNELRFQQLVEKLETDAFELRDEVERLYTQRCTSLASCQHSNYDECNTELPNPICPAGLGLHISDCGEAASCSGLYDFTVSSFSLPPGSTDAGPGGNPVDHRLIESVCFSRHLDSWFQQKESSSELSWEDLGFATFFGSNTGAFRIYPARHSEACNSYDPRVRPWYVAGSSGRKNIIMVLDKSGSMSGTKLSLLKEATKRVIDTLTVGDRVALVFFDSEATSVAKDDQFLFEATEQNKASLKNEVEKLSARGGTNFYDAFVVAFDILDASVSQELLVSCNTAVLFLTDGKMSPVPGQTEATVRELVEQRILSLNENTGKPVLMFTYSITSNEEDTHAFPSLLACSTKLGTWSRIDDEEQIVDALSSYYLLFALGLGVDRNLDFAAWVEPYEFSTGGILGTTVSVPVYDRSKSPHLFLGVVGIDLALAALNEALGSTDNTQSIARLAARSGARCPELELTPCELDFYREATSGEAARCLEDNCTADDFVETQDKECGIDGSYPTDIFANRALSGESYEERVCCSVTGESSCQLVVSSSSSEGGGAPVAVIVACSVCGALAIVVIGVLINRRKKSQAADAKASTAHSPHPEPSSPIFPMPPPKFAPHQQH